MVAEHGPERDVAETEFLPDGDGSIPEQARHLAYAALNLSALSRRPIRAGLICAHPLEEGEDDRIANSVAQDLETSRLQPSINILGQQRRFGVLQFEILQNIAGLGDA